MVVSHRVRIQYSSLPAHKLYADFSSKVTAAVAMIAVGPRIGVASSGCACDASAFL